MDYSYRDLEFGQFARMFKECVDNEDVPEHRCRGKVMDRMQHAEDGRFEKMVDAVHRQVSALDPDERRLFADRNPGLMARVKEWGAIQEAAAFRDVDTPHDKDIPTRITQIQGGNGDSDEDSEVSVDKDHLKDFQFESKSDLPLSGDM